MAKKTETVTTVAPVMEFNEPVAIPDAATQVGFVSAASELSPYLTFPNENTGKMAGTGKWQLYLRQHPDLQQYEPVIVYPTALGDELIRTTPGMRFSMYWLGGFACYAQFNISTGEVIRAWKHEPEGVQSEAYSEGVLLVSARDGGYVPCRASFRKALTRIGFAGDLAVTSITNDWANWLKQKPEFGGIPLTVPPKYRAKIEVQITTPRSKSSGFLYPAPTVSVAPSTPEDLQKIQDALNKYSDAYKAAVNGYSSRMSDVIAKISG